MHWRAGLGPGSLLLTAPSAQRSVLGWASSERRSGSARASGAVGLQLTPRLAYLPSDAFELALGPSLDRLLTMNSSSTATTATAGADWY